MPLAEETLITLKDKTTKKVEDLKINDELVTYTIDGLENIQNMEILQKKELDQKMLKSLYHHQNLVPQ